MKKGIDIVVIDDNNFFLRKMDIKLKTFFSKIKDDYNIHLVGKNNIEAYKH